MRQHQRPTPLGGEMTATLGHRLGVLPLGDVDGPRRCFASKGGQKIYRCDYVFFTQNYCDFFLRWYILRARGAAQILGTASGPLPQMYKFPNKEVTLGHTRGPIWAPIFWAALF